MRNIIDDAFSIGIELKRAGFVGSIRCLWTSGSSANTRNNKDRRGLVASPIPKSVLSGEREDQLLRE